VDFISAKIAGYYKLYGPNTSLNSACTSGLTGIDFAINTLKTDPELDGMIVGGVDHLVEPIFMYWFQTLGALAISDDPSANCPFDTKRSGFVMGEGAATLIIEPMSKALARGANIYAIIRSTHLSTLYESDTSPDLSGDGAKLCVLKALEKAQVAASDISYINAHATSTPIGDKIEFDCVYSLMPGRVMVSNKGQLGHTMAGAGIVETIYTLLAMKHSTTPPNINLTDPLDTGMILPTSQMALDIKYAIKNSFGFGGRNSSIVLERYDG
jgi:3-oxoacyl-[acyl-carrier-protein] synthase II